MFKKFCNQVLGKRSIEDAFFNDYNERMRLMNLRTVYTASSRGTKPGVRG